MGDMLVLKFIWAFSQMRNLLNIFSLRRDIFDRFSAAI